MSSPATGALYRNTILEGDVRERLKALADESVHCVVTSPPYWSQRDYGTATWEGGDAACQHGVRPAGSGLASSTLGGGKATTGHQQEGYPLVCPRCGARRVDAQLGQEATLEEYVANIVAVFREVRRVLRRDGTLWLNLGDSYNAAGRQGHGTRIGPKQQTNRASANGRDDNRPTASGLKPKDLMMMPARVALALQADGWYLRSDIVWSKSNPMPESVTDRPARSHEYVFLLSKSARYYYDAEAVKEEGTSGASDLKKMAENKDRLGGFYKDATDPLMAASAATNIGRKRGVGKPGFRNRRTVWEIATEPFPGPHFATFPMALVLPCIQAGTSERGCCAECGAPWRRVLERTPYGDLHPQRDLQHGRNLNNLGGQDFWEEEYEPPRTIGWAPSCTCGAPKGVRSDDLELINSPFGRGGTRDDPTMRTGRAGMNRERDEDEGSVPITRYEQRQYAAQLRDSAHRAVMEEEVGEAFAHYIRTDKSGGRPLPPDLMASWSERGWLAHVAIPAWQSPPVVPALVLDPFLGSGTTAVVALRAARDYVGIELNPEYVAMAEARLAPLKAQGRML